MPLTSYYTALTGLNNSGYAINVIGNNLANMNTTAYKSGEATFAELLAGVSGTDSSGNPISDGLGSTLNGIAYNNSQGTITSTGVSTNASISGNGFFVVSNNGGMGYTRNGQFTIDKDGYLTSSDGYKVMGYMATNGVVDSNGAIAPIEVKIGQIIPASATSSMSINANLDSEAADDSTFSTSVQVFDSLGTVHTSTVTFTKTGSGAWSWKATIPAVDTGGASTDDPVEIGSGDLAFDSSGKLTSPTDNPTLDITGLADKAADMKITFNLLDSSGSSLITNYAADSAVSSTTQDGFAASALSSISFDKSGKILGVTESGRSVAIAQLALADFMNVDGLQKYEGSTFVASTSSGEPSIGVAGNGGRGTIVGSSLEQSNVDMSLELVNLIKAQRAYQANSKVITATDELYQSTLNMKT